MAKKYLVWKDRNCNGINPEWIEMTGEEFYAFISKEENKKRRFIVLNNRICEDADVIIMEANEAEFLRFQKEYDHAKYLHRFEKQVSFVSLSEPLCEGEELCYEDILADESVDVENNIIRIEKLRFLREFFLQLTDEERGFLYFLYIQNKNMSECEIAKIYHLSRKGINRKKQKIRKKFQNYVSKNEI